MLFQLYLMVGNLTIKLMADYPLNLDRNLEKFVVNVGEKYDVVCHVKEAFLDISQKQKIFSDQYTNVYVDRQKIFKEYLYAENGIKKEAILLRKKNIRHEYDLVIKPRTNKFVVEDKYIPLDEILVFNGGILLHSSFVLYNGQAILFSAPSGTGKTTQAELWAKHMGATIVNGDRTALMKIDGVWHGCGCFYKGSSDYCENITAPVAAIITLGQAPVNKSYELSEKEKFTALYRESIVHTWDPEYVRLLMDSIEDCTKSVRMEHFDCVPDESAVLYIKKLIFDN